MVEKPLLYFLAKLVTVIASLVIASTTSVDMAFSVISTLSFACVFFLEILLQFIWKNKKTTIVLALLTIVVCFALGLDTFFPLYIILMIQLLDIMIRDKMFYEILIVSTLLSIFIFSPGVYSITITLILLTLILIARVTMDKLSYYKEVADDQKVMIGELEKKLNDIKSLMKTLRYTASLEERNRIAARIHDQIGHGISGSIIMLEASMLVMKDKPDKAAESIQKAISNLREGVDEIRMALREERSSRYTLGMNDLTAMLEEFKVSYQVSTYINTIGDLSFINIELWSCIHDNLKECLTNVLKHSNATEFTLNIEVFKKLIKVEYKDNGKSTEGFEKGLGLEGIEERTIQAKGRCMFNKGEKGFSITNIFPL